MSMVNLYKPYPTRIACNSHHLHFILPSQREQSSAGDSIPFLSCWKQYSSFPLLPDLKSLVDLQTAPGLRITHLKSSPPGSPPPQPHMFEAAGWPDLWSINQLHLAQNYGGEERGCRWGYVSERCPRLKERHALQLQHSAGWPLTACDLHVVSHSVQQQKLRGPKTCFFAWCAIIDRKVSSLLLECLF